MREKNKVDLERPKLVIATSSILFICSIASLVDFAKGYQTFGFGMQTLLELIFALLLILLGFIIFKVTHLTTGITVSFLIGSITTLLQIGQQIVGISIIFEGVGPIIAGIVGYFARRRIPWLIEREEPRFRELKFTLRMIKKSKITLVATGVIILFCIMAVTSVYIAPHDPLKLHLKNKLQGPSSQYLLGTDEVGRDIFSRLIWGTRISLICGILVVVISVTIGVPLGSISGYFGGKVDEVLMRITDVFMAFPGLTLAMVMAYVLGRGLFSAIVGLSMVSWCMPARLVRGVVLSEREKEYVMAARALGKSDIQIIFEEILPNGIYPIIVFSMMNLAATIIEVAGLSFIGVGIQPPTPDWGIMITTGRQFLMYRPLYAIVPGLLIMTLVLAFNIIGDTLRDALDPSLRRKR